MEPKQVNQYNKKGLCLPLNDIYPTIQGEGTHTGEPIIMVRLQGCPVGCPFCDTKETWDLDPEHEVPKQATWHETIESVRTKNPKWAWIHAVALAKFIDSRGYAGRAVGENTQEYLDKWQAEWVVITGGEPADYRLDVFILNLKLLGYKVAIETSGTSDTYITECSDGDGDPDWVTVSPKLDMPGGRKVVGDALLFADEIKFPVGRKEDIDKLLKFLQDYKPWIHEPTKIYLQPLSRSKKATAIAVEACHRYQWKLSVQTQYFIGLP